MKLFWERGFEGTSFDELISAMDISPSSFYNAFGTREDLFRESLAAYRALLPRFPEARGADQRVLPRLTAFSWFHSSPRSMFMFWMVKVLSAPIRVGSLPTCTENTSFGTILR